MFVELDDAGNMFVVLDRGDDKDVPVLEEVVPCDAACVEL